MLCVGCVGYVGYVEVDWGGGSGGWRGRCGVYGGSSWDDVGRPEAFTTVRLSFMLSWYSPGVWVGATGLLGISKALVVCDCMVWEGLVCTAWVVGDEFLRFGRSAVRLTFVVGLVLVVVWVGLAGIGERCLGVCRDNCGFLCGVLFPSILIAVESADSTVSECSEDNSPCG